LDPDRESDIPRDSGDSDGQERKRLGTMRTRSNSGHPHATVASIATDLPCARCDVTGEKRSSEPAEDFPAALESTPTGERR
jgi:hypothetical protein